MRSWCAGSRRSRSARHRAPRRRVSCSLRPVGRAQRGPLERLTAATGLFRPDEVAIAVELLDDARADYASTRAFYERRGYTQAARLPGYYAPGDDLVIYLKDLTHGALATATA